jgi:hypothetical protein
MCFFSYLLWLCVIVRMLPNHMWRATEREKEKRKKKNFGLRRRPTWIKCLFDPPPIWCPQDKGMEVQIYSSLSRVDTIKACHTSLWCLYVLLRCLNTATPWSSIRWASIHLIMSWCVVHDGLAMCAQRSCYPFIWLICFLGNMLHMLCVRYI